MGVWTKLHTRLPDTLITHLSCSEDTCPIHMFPTSGTCAKSGDFFSFIPFSSQAQLLNTLFSSDGQSILRGELDLNTFRPNWSCKLSFLLQRDCYSLTYWQIYTNVGHPCHGRKEQADLPSSLVPNLKKGFGATNPDPREGPESCGLCRHSLGFPYDNSRWFFHSLLAAVIPG